MLLFGGGGRNAQASNDITKHPGHRLEVRRIQNSSLFVLRGGARCSACVFYDMLQVRDAPCNQNRSEIVRRHLADALS